MVQRINRFLPFVLERSKWQLIIFSQWTLNWTNIGWTFRSVGSGLYLGLNGSPSDGTRLVAVTTPVGWHIWHDEIDSSTYRSVRL